jgi:hypothetical protein
MSGDAESTGFTTLPVEPRVVLSQPPIAFVDLLLKLRKKTIGYVITSIKHLRWKSFTSRGPGKL